MEKTVSVPHEDESLFEQRRRVRRVRMILDLTSTLISRDASLTCREARCLIDCAERAVLELLPSFEEKFRTFVRPRLERIVNERWPVGVEGTGLRLVSELVN